VFLILVIVIHPDFSFQDQDSIDYDKDDNSDIGKGGKEIHRSGLRVNSIKVLLFSLSKRPL
jgi:hypothetical protein